MTDITRLITHSGAFHADDLFAGALLTRLFDVEILRTRNQATIDAAGDDTIVFDVGNVYDPDTRRFDHHQPGKPLRHDGLSYSSFGLVWKHYGKDYIRTLLGHDICEDDIETVHARIDRGFVRDIDALDNGQIMPGQEGALHPLSISSMLMDMRPVFDNHDRDAMDQAYLDTLPICQVFIANKVKQVAAKIRSRKIVLEAIADRGDPRWIELPCGMDYQGPILEAGEAAKDILFVINPSDAEWQLNVVNVKRGSYEARKQLPAAWSGLRGADLAKLTGAQDAIFSHMERFFACAGSRASILLMLEQALEA